MLGAAMIALPALGLWHLWAGSPDTPAGRAHAAGFIGFAIGGPLSEGLTAWICAPLLFIGALFGLLLLTGTTIREVPDTLRSMFGTRMFDYRDGDEYYDDDRARKAVSPKTFPTATTTILGVRRRRSPGVAVERRAGRRGRQPDGAGAHGVARPQAASQRPENRCQARHPGPRPGRRGPVHTAVAEPAGGRRSAEEAQRRQRPDGRFDQLGAATVQGRRRGHRLHARADRHPLRGRAGPRRQGGEDHRAAEEHRLRGGHRERPDAGADPGQVRRRHRGAQHRPRDGAPGRRAHRAVDPPRPPPAGDRAGQGHRRRLHLGQPGQDAAPAGRRFHRLRQVQLRQLDAGVAADPVPRRKRSG